MLGLKVILRRLSVLNPDQKRDQVRHAVDDPFLRSYKSSWSLTADRDCCDCAGANRDVVF